MGKLSFLEVKTIVEIKNGNDQAFTVLKEKYEQAIKYIVLRRLKKESDVEECLGEIYAQFPMHANEYDQKRMNIGTWFMLFAKICADDYFAHSLKPVRKVTLSNGLQIEVPYKYEYDFEFKFEFGYENSDLALFMSEEEYVVLFFRDFYKLPFQTIAKLLDLTTFSVNTLYVIATRKIGRYLLSKENYK